MKKLFSYTVSGQLFYTPYQWLAVLRDDGTAVEL